MKYLYPLLFLTLCIGCGGQSGVTGKVTFKEDGSPLTTGTVVFSKPQFQAYGSIGKDGTYTLGSYKANDGTQTGDYTVYITGAETTPQKEGELGKSLIDEKYANPETSGLKCAVKGTTVFDITVEKPKPEEKGKRK
jgi:hypothetical protein